MAARQERQTRTRPRRPIDDGIREGAAGVNRDDEVVGLYNDMGNMKVALRVSPAVRPGQLIIYNGFEPYQFQQWHDPANVEPGMVKWLAFAGGYGHLRYRGIHWQPVPIDRAIRLDVRKIESATAKEAV